MNVQTVNPFAFAAADGSATPAPGGTATVEAAAAFAALLANMVTGVQVEPEPLVGEMVADETPEVADEETEPETESEDSSTPSLWLPDGMVTVAAPLLGSATPTVQVPVSAESSTEAASILVTVPVTIDAATGSAEAPLPVAAGATSEEAPALPATGSALLESLSQRKIVGSAQLNTEAVATSSEAGQIVQQQPVESTARLVSASSVVAAEVENKATTDSKQVVQELLAKGNAMTASEPVQTATQVEADKLSKKAQQREFAARIAAAGEQNPDGGVATDVSGASGLGAGESLDKAAVSGLRTLNVETEASASLTSRKFDEILSNEADDAGTTDSSRQVTPTVSHKENVAVTAVRTAATAAPVEVPVTELPKMTENSIKQMLDSGEQRMSIRIKPDTLGEMQIEVTRSGSDVQVRLTAATQVVRDMLDSHAPQLREALAREGFDGARIQVSPPSSSAGLNLGHAGAGQQGQHAQQEHQQQGGHAWWSGQRLSGAATSSGTPAQTRPLHAGAGGAALNVTV